MQLNSNQFKKLFCSDEADREFRKFMKGVRQQDQSGSAATKVDPTMERSKSVVPATKQSPTFMPLSMSGVLEHATFQSRRTSLQKSIERE